MKIEVEVTHADFRELLGSVTRIAKSRSKGRRFFGTLVNVLLWTALALVFLLVFEFLKEERIETSAFLGGAFFTLAAIFGLYLWFRYAFQKALAPNPEGPILGHRTFNFDESGISEVCELTKSFADWDGIVNIVETNDHLFFMIDAIAGYIVPKRAIGVQADISSFMLEIKRLRGSAEKAT